MKENCKIYNQKRIVIPTIPHPSTIPIWFKNKIDNDRIVAKN